MRSGYECLVVLLDEFCGELFFGKWDKYEICFIEVKN
jgi:hypothetical protein